MFMLNYYNLATNYYLLRMYLQSRYQNGKISNAYKYNTGEFAIIFMKVYYIR